MTFCLERVIKTRKTPLLFSKIELKTKTIKIHEVKTHCFRFKI